MRKLGVAGLGLLLIEVIAVGGDGLMPDSLTQALLLGYLTPVPVIVVVALVIDGRLRHRYRAHTWLEGAVSLLVRV